MTTGANVRVYTHSDAVLGPKRSFTPEGFLFCEDVPLARTGVQSYQASEINLPAGPDGWIHVDRRPEDVFDPKAMASFVAKPVTDDHPEKFVTPDSFSKYSRGTILNPRQGTGELANTMVCDLLIMERSAIDAILSGKREVSCGYMAEYEVLGPGRARQFDIQGNHVALVRAGRCGPLCAIGDEAVSETKVKKASRTVTWKDKARAALTLKDAKALDEALEEALEEGEGQGGGTGHSVHVHVGTSASESKEEGEEVGDKKTVDAITKAVTDALAPVMTRLTALEKGKTKDSADETDEEKEAREKREKEEKDKATKDGAARVVYDAAALPGIIQDLKSRAEILVPGIRLAAIDAKGDPKVVTDTICMQRRQVLQTGLMLPASAAIMQPFMDGLPQVSRMSCDQVDLVLKSTSEVAKLKNGPGGGTTGGAVRKVGDAEFKGAITPAEINARNAAHYGKRK